MVQNIVLIQMTTQGWGRRGGGGQHVLPTRGFSFKGLIVLSH